MQIAKSLFNPVANTVDENNYRLWQTDQVHDRLITMQLKISSDYDFQYIHCYTLSTSLANLLNLYRCNHLSKITETG